MLGHTEYIGVLPGRTCIDSVYSIDCVDLHRLFTDTKSFEPVDGDPLINVFADYSWIVTFLGEPDSHFEQNLIFTANCSHSAEVVTLSMKPPKNLSTHITDFYTRQFIDQSDIPFTPEQPNAEDCLIKATEADVKTGRELLREIDVDFATKLIVIQPGSGGVHKCWHLDNFLSVADKISSNGIEVVFLLGPAEFQWFSNPQIKSIESTAGCLTDLPFTQVLGLLSCADGYLGNDSGITHLAAALGVETVAVFGPSNPAVYRPIGPNVTVFSSGSAAFTEQSSASLQQQLLAVLIAQS